MSTVYGYIRIATADAADSGIHLGQLRGLVRETFLHRLGGDHAIGEVFEDGPDEARRNLRQRKAGFRLEGALARGDVVLVPGLARSFRSVRDLTETAAAWRDRGVRLWVIDADVDTGTDLGWRKLEFARALLSLNRAATGDVVRVKQKKAREEGKLIGRPSWGTRMKGPRKGKRYLEVIPELYEVGKKIVQWHLEGYSLPAIYHHLRDSGVTRARNRTSKRHSRMTWTLDMVENAYDRCLILLGKVRRGEVREVQPKGGTGEHQGGRGDDRPAGGQSGVPGDDHPGGPRG